MGRPGAARPGRGFLWAATGLGLVHAAFSLCWALGGTWLLDTVGQWAVRQVEEAPVASRLMLAGTAAVKGAAAVIPTLSAYRRFPYPRIVRAVSWAGAVGLVLYGGANTLAANAVLAGLVPAGPETDLSALKGHAWLWDPLFLLWGAALLGYLVRSARRPWDTPAAKRSP